MEHVENLRHSFVSRSFHVFMAGAAAQVIVLWASFFCILSYIVQ
jgi:hypothetical protein